MIYSFNAFGALKDCFQRGYEMNPTDFNAPAAGKVIQTPLGYFAFLPSPLPPEIIYDERLVLALSRADTALSELSGLGRHLPNPNLLIAPYIRREAVLSSRIEGTRADLVDIWLEDIPGGEKQVEAADVQEVRNYVTALEFGIQRLTELPLSLRLVRETHARLMAGVRGEQATPGEFRRSQNWIGPAGSTLADAPYVPPPPDEMIAALGEWEGFLHERGRFPELIQCALIHEQFEAIHPFLDGNGRIGRLLITLFLIERGRLSQPLLYLSAYIEAHRQEYYDLLQRVRTQADWNPWINFFLRGVMETAQQALHQTAVLMELRERYYHQLRDTPRTMGLIDELFVNPYLSVARAETILGVSNPTARKAVELLAQRGILRETTGREWGKVFLAVEISDAIQNPPAI
jgi:Fic family protein